MKQKRTKIKDQLFNGAFKNAKLTNSSKSVLFGSALLIVLSSIVAKKL
jgi:hypothetical protein